MLNQKPPSKILIKNSKVYFLIILICIIIDLASKIIATKFLPSPPFFLNVTSFLNFKVIINTGISFSFLQMGTGVERWALVLLSLLITFFLIIWLLSATDSSIRIGLALVISGSFGNLLDRIYSGGVTDFIQVHLFAHYFPIFNIADVFISAGAFLIILKDLQDIIAKRVIK